MKTAPPESGEPLELESGDNYSGPLKFKRNKKRDKVRKFKPNRER